LDRIPNQGILITTPVSDSRQDIRDIARGTATNLAGLLLRGFAVAFLLVLGRLYGAELTGFYLLSFAIVDAIANLATLGLDRGVLTLAGRYHAVGDGEAIRRTVVAAIQLGLLSSLAVTALLELAAPLIARGLFDKAELAVPLRVMALALPCWTVSAVLLFASRAMRVMRFQIVTKNVVEPGIKLAVAFGAAVLGLGLSGLAVAVPLSALAGVVAAAGFFSRQIPLTSLRGARGLGAERRGLFRLAAPIGCYDLLNQLLRRMDVFLVGRFVSGADLGIYAAAIEAASVVKTVRQAVDPILIPVLAGAQHRCDHAAMLGHYRIVTRWLLILDAAVLGGFAVAAHSVMGIMGPDFTAGATVLVLVTAAFMLNGVLGVAEVFLLIDRPVLNLVNSLGTLVVQVCLILLLVPRFGLLGAGLATLLSLGLMNLARVIQVARRYRLQPFTLHHAKAVVAALLAVLIVVGIRRSWPATTGAAADGLAAGGFLLLYLAALVTLGLASPEREKVSAWLRRS
jgi:O-antigen/teichoic acid export membrane protein